MSNLPSPADIAGMQAEIEAIFDGQVEIKRQTRTSNGQGGSSTAYNTVATVACKRAPASTGSADAEVLVADAVRSEVKWVFTMPSGTEVRSGDRLVQDGRTFEVQVSTWDRGDLDLATRAFCSEEGKA